MCVCVCFPLLVDFQSHKYFGQKIWLIWFKFSFFYYFVLEYSQLPILYYFQVNSEGIQPYKYMWPFSPKLPSHSGCPTVCPCCLFIVFFCLFILLYIIVLVLPYTDLDPPWVYMCSPSWTRLPPPSPSHPSGSSQCTNPKHPVSCVKPGLVIHFTYDNLHVSMPFSLKIQPSPSPTESKTPFNTSVSLLLSHIQGYGYHLSKFRIYALVYCIGIFLYGLLHSV